MSQLSLSSALPFGKYKGLTVAAVIRIDVGYLVWAIKNVPGFDLDMMARCVGQRALSAERAARQNRQEAWAWGFGKQARAAADAARARRAAIEQRERRAAKDGG